MGGNIYVFAADMSWVVTDVRQHWIPYLYQLWVIKKCTVKLPWLLYVIYDNDNLWVIQLPFAVDHNDTLPLPGKGTNKGITLFRYPLPLPLP